MKKYPFIPLKVVTMDMTLLANIIQDTKNAISPLMSMKLRSHSAITNFQNHRKIGQIANFLSMTIDYEEFGIK